MRKTAALLTLLFTGASCALFRSKPPLYPEGVVFPLVPAETMSIPGEITGEVLREGAVLFLATRSGSVMAVDAAVFRVLWTRDVADSLRGGIVQGARGFFVHDGTTLFCLDRGGEIVWSAPSGGEITGGVIDEDGCVYVGLDKGIAALDTADGTTLWLFETPEAVASRPALAGGAVVFGCDDHRLYFLSPAGKKLADLAVGGEIRGELLADADRVYFGAYDRTFYCADAARRRLKWHFLTGGIIHPQPVIDGKRLFFVNHSGVIYCVNKKNGHVIWWRQVPGRSAFRPQVIDKRLVVSTLAPRVLCFDTETGQARGEFQAPDESGANPVWVMPLLGLTLIDEDKKTSRLVFLKKQVDVNLKFGPDPPVRMNQEIVVVAEALGFFRPEYEFTLSQLRMVRFGLSGWMPVEIESSRETARAKSPEAAWSWFPEKPGFYRMAVRVVDEKEKGGAQRLYRVLPLQKRAAGETDTEKTAPPVKKKAADGKPEAGKASPAEKKPTKKKNIK